MVDEATFEAANANRSKSAIGHNTRKYLLTNILACDKCKAPMVGHTDKLKGFRYRCSVQSGGCGGTTIKGEWVDDFVERYMSNMVAFDWLANPVEAPDNTVALEAVDTRIAALQQGMGDGTIDLGDAMAALKIARAERAILVTEDAGKVEATFYDAVEDYEALNLSAKRTMIKRYFEYIFIRPYFGKKAFDDRRIYCLMTERWRAGLTYRHETLTHEGQSFNVNYARKAE